MIFNNTQKLLAGTLALILVAGLGTPAFADETLYAVSSQDDQLRTIDPNDGSTLDSVTITLAGEVVIGATGLATSPNGVLTAVLRLDSDPLMRELVTLDPMTGIATSIGNLGQPFAAIAYSNSGQLMGITGGNGNPSHGVHDINTNDASILFLCPRHDPLA